MNDDFEARQKYNDRVKVWSESWCICGLREKWDLSHFEDQHNSELEKLVCEYGSVANCTGKGVVIFGEMPSTILGNGRIAMSHHFFELLRKHTNKLSSLLGKINRYAANPLTDEEHEALHIPPDAIGEGILTRLAELTKKMGLTELPVKETIH